MSRYILIAPVKSIHDRGTAWRSCLSSAVGCSKAVLDRRHAAKPPPCCCAWGGLPAAGISEQPRQHSSRNLREPVLYGSPQPLYGLIRCSFTQGWRNGRNLAHPAQTCRAAQQQAAVAKQQAILQHFWRNQLSRTAAAHSSPRLMGFHGDSMERLRPIGRVGRSMQPNRRPFQIRQ